MARRRHARTGGALTLAAKHKHAFVHVKRKSHRVKSHFGKHYINPARYKKGDSDNIVYEGLPKFTGPNAFRRFLNKIYKPKRGKKSGSGAMSMG